jgi:hypothetical protein
VINEAAMSRAHLIEKYVFKNSHFYVTFQEKEDFAVKCFPRQSENPLDQLAFILREYSFYRIAGCLGIGPALLTPFGFDIIIYEECIEFAMEQMDPIHKSPTFWS